MTSGAPIADMEAVQRSNWPLVVPLSVSLCSPGYRLLAKGGPDLDTPGLFTCQELSERKAIASQRLL